MAHPARSLGIAGLSLAILLTAFGASSRAQRGGDGDRPPTGPPPPPPPVAFEACKNKKADGACEVTFRDRKITGTCAAFKEGELFCRPRHRPSPPPELFASCEGKAEGDRCNIRLDDVERQGRCGQGRSGRLLCLPQ